MDAHDSAADAADHPISGVRGDDMGGGCTADGTPSDRSRGKNGVHEIHGRKSRVNS